MANNAVAQGVLAILKSVNNAVLSAAAQQKQSAGAVKLAPKNCGRCPITGLPLAPTGGKR